MFRSASSPEQLAALRDHTCTCCLSGVIAAVLAGPRDGQEAPPEPGAVGWSGPVGRPTFLLAGDPPDADLPNGNGNGDARDAARPAQEASRPAVDGS